MNWYKIAQINEQIEYNYPLAGNIVSGLNVKNEIPNLSSIQSSLSNYTELKGIREIPMSDFHATGKHYSSQGTQNINELANQIKHNKEISPLIIVIDKEGPYILEGATRLEALFKLNINSFPALVIIDNQE